MSEERIVNAAAGQRAAGERIRKSEEENGTKAQDVTAEETVSSCAQIALPASIGARALIAALGP